MNQGLELYERAIEIDPHFVPALAGLASVHALRFTYTTDPAGLERAAAYARRAIAVESAAGRTVSLARIRHVAAQSGGRSRRDAAPRPRARPVAPLGLLFRRSGGTPSRPRHRGAGADSSRDRAAAEGRTDLASLGCFISTWATSRRLSGATSGPVTSIRCRMPARSRMWAATWPSATAGRTTQ